MEMNGHVSQDTLNVAGLSIENYLFAEAKDVYPISYLADYDGFDGSLGLAPSSALSVLGMPNPFNMMMEQGILDENLFALKLPRGVLWAEEEDGELTFGEIPKALPEAELTRIPLLNDTESPLNGYWTSEIRSLFMGDGSTVYAPLDNFTAIFSSAFPIIGLPRDLAIGLTLEIGAKRWGWLYTVPCDRRKDLKDLSFDLAGNNFTITPWEYLLEVEAPNGTHYCISTFWPYSDLGENTIVLGTAFLKRFWSVWDWDRWEAGCKFSKSPREPYDISDVTDRYSHI